MSLKGAIVKVEIVLSVSVNERKNDTKRERESERKEDRERVRITAMASKTKFTTTFLNSCLQCMNKRNCENVTIFFMFVILSQQSTFPENSSFSQNTLSHKHQCNVSISSKLTMAQLSGNEQAHERTKNKTQRCALKRH